MRGQLPSQRDKAPMIKYIMDNAGFNEPCSKSKPEFRITSKKTTTVLDMDAFPFRAIVAACNDYNRTRDVVKAHLETDPLILNLNTQRKDLIINEVVYLIGKYL
jgi:hypothetical protein